MNNPRMTKKEMGLVKGALRRVFSRSEIRRQAIDTSRIKHSDPKRPRVTKWSMCKSCSTPTPTYLMQVDHVAPLVPIDKALEDMSWDEVIERLWCHIDNLNPLCQTCHKAKSKAEAAERRKNKKGKRK